MSRGDEETFASRWARLKRASAKPAPAPAAPASPPPALPPPESLAFDSDFAAFMHAKVDEGVRRAALRRLFSDPRFNLMDGLDIYIDDYNREDPIPAAMLAGLEHAKRALLAPETETKTEKVAEAKASAQDDA
jgi:hypothetical protein